MPDKLLIIFGLIIIIISLYVRLREIKRCEIIEMFEGTDVSGNKNNQIDSTQIIIIMGISFGLILFLIGLYFLIKKSTKSQKSGDVNEYSSSSKNDNYYKKIKKERLEWEREYEKNKREYKERKKAEKASTKMKENNDKTDDKENTAEKDEKVENQMSLISKIKNLFKNRKEQEEKLGIIAAFDKKVKDSGAKEMVILTASIPILKIFENLKVGFENKDKCEDLLETPISQSQSQSPSTQKVEPLEPKITLGGISNIKDIIEELFNSQTESSA